MPDIPDIDFTNDWITSRRGKKNKVSEYKPYAFPSEQECTADGSVQDVLTVFLTNSECPFKCLMCDLWKNTLDHPVSKGSIIRQIKYALKNSNDSRIIKLYNSGNFFDTNAIPVEDYEGIADILSGFRNVIVESHPKLINKRVIEFKEMLKPDLEIALGLETIHPEVLRKLNKRMNIEEFRKAVKTLTELKIKTRSFILLRPPFLSENEGVEWAKKSIDFSFDIGVDSCVVIPTRPGNGSIDWLMTRGYFNPPSIASLEEVLEYGISLGKGRVFADTWDLNLFSTCPNCLNARENRIQQMNLHQKYFPDVKCTCSS